VFTETDMSPRDSAASEDEDYDYDEMSEKFYVSLRGSSQPRTEYFAVDYAEDAEDYADSEDFFFEY
jgi:hypothetical protein